MEDNMFRQMILNYLKENERSQAWLARKCELSRSFLCMYLHGEKGMSERNKGKIMKIISFKE